MSVHRHAGSVVVLAIVLLASCGDGSVLNTDATAASTTRPQTTTTVAPVTTTASTTAAPASTTSMPTEVEITGIQTIDETTVLEVFVDSCEAGDDLACDITYIISPADSAEEAIGLTCDGRGDSFCTGYDPDTSTAFGYGDDPFLDALADLCGAGIVDACMGLYVFSPIGSEYEAYGLEGSG